MSAGLRARLAAWPQYLLPQHGLSALARRLSGCRRAWLGRAMIDWFCRRYEVDIDEAEPSDPRQYACFDDFFTRPLKPDRRPIADHGTLVCPCDGTISRLGRIEHDRLLQAKGMHYTTAALLGGRERARIFDGGHFITLYLAPGDYHRVHSPAAGRLIEEVRIPGRLFSVSPATTQTIPGLFTRNERMVAMLETARGPVAVLMVAALLVAGIETVWGGPHDRRPGRAVRVRSPADIVLARGGELGRFHWGSTVIMLTPADFPDWHAELAAGRRVQLGRPLCD